MSSYRLQGDMIRVNKLGLMDITFFWLHQADEGGRAVLFDMICNDWREGALQKSKK
jgi:hypothetical protein